jgi:hypothetical protein
MARRHKGRFVKKEEMPTEMQSDEMKEEPKKSEEKSAKSAEKPQGSFDTIALFVVGLIVGLAIGGLIFYSMGMGSNTNNGATAAQMNAVGQKALDFIKNNNLIGPTQTISLVNVSEVNGTGIFQLTLNITSNGQSQVFESYATKNVEVLCPSGILTADVTAQAQNQTDNTQTPADPQAACAQMTKADKPLLEAYIVSRCPYGLQMQRIMAEIINKAPESAQYMKVRYIGSVENGKVTAMHGEVEAQENLLQICIREEQPTKYWPYVGCYMKEGNTTGCITTAGVDKAQLDSCMNDGKRGVAYAQKDFDMANQNGVSGSPTLFINGKKGDEFAFAVNGTAGRSAQALNNLLCCGFNTQPALCSTTMLTTGAATMFSAGYNGASSSASCG